MRILVAEDDATTAVLLRRLLTNWGYEVEVVADGDGAWRVLESEDRPPLAVLDCVMPGLGGFELCRKIRAELPAGAVYVVLLTTLTRPEDIQAGLIAGGDDYVVKPFDPGVLKARILVGRRIVETQDALRENIRRLEDALGHVERLQGIIPLCMYCHRIRDDREAWHRLEAYVSDHSEARFSHGICPDCLSREHDEMQAGNSSPR